MFHSPAQGKDAVKIIRHCGFMVLLWLKFPFLSHICLADANFLHLELCDFLSIESGNQGVFILILPMALFD